MLFVRERAILVCLPTYHSPKEWIARAVDSLISQTYSNFECWIVKDGCRQSGTFNPPISDATCLECENCKETKAFCTEIVQSDHRFKFFSMPINFGAAGWGPRNFTIMNTTHEFIAYLDDDNWYEPDHLESLYKAIGDKDMAYTGTHLWSSDGKMIRDRIHPHLPKQGYIDTSEILHRRRLIEQFGGWRWVKKGNDWDMVSRWVPNISWAHTNKVTLNFFVRDNCGIHRL